jgi:hypothetical protein
VRQHTGHLSNELRRYREFATSVTDLKLGDALPLRIAIPELAGMGQNLGQAEKPHPTRSENRDEKSRLLN